MLRWCFTVVWGWNHGAEWWFGSWCRMVFRGTENGTENGAENGGLGLESIENGGTGWNRTTDWKREEREKGKGNGDWESEEREKGKGRDKEK